MNAAVQQPPVLFNNLGTEPIHRAIRRLRWFKSSFITQVELISDETGIKYETDTEILARCFISWLKLFEANKPDDESAYQAYVGHASGLMLRRLIELKPLKTVSIPEPRDNNDPAQFWPEGYVYVMYCLNVRHLVLKRAFSGDSVFTNEFPDIQTWWSFKENVDEMPSYAIPFLDLFAGEAPDFGSLGNFHPDAKQNLVALAGYANDQVDSQLSQTVNEQATDELIYGLQLDTHFSQVVIASRSGELLYDRRVAFEFISIDNFVDQHATYISDWLEFGAGSVQPKITTAEKSLLVSIPPQLVAQYDEIKSNLEARTQSQITIIDSISAAAIIEATKEPNALTPGFLFVSTEALDTPKLIFNGDILSGSIADGPQLPGQFTALSTTTVIDNLTVKIQVLNELMGLNDIVVHSTDTGEKYSNLMDNLALKLPQLQLHSSNTELTAAAFARACLYLKERNKSD